MVAAEAVTELLQATCPTGHWLIAEAEVYLGACLLAQDHFDGAESLLKDSYETLVHDHGPDFHVTETARAHLITLYQQE